jgi:hypothetical protein
LLESFFHQNFQESYRISSLDVKHAEAEVVVQFGKIPHFVRDDNRSKYVISSAARNLSHSMHPSDNQTETSPKQGATVTAMQ